MFSIRAMLVWGVFVFLFNISHGDDLYKIVRPHMKSLNSPQEQYLTPFVESLDVSDSSSFEKVQMALGDLPSVRQINFMNMRLTERDFANILKRKQIVDVRYDAGTLLGEVDFSKWAGVESLSISKQKLTITQIERIAKCPHLKRLSFDQCAIEDLGPLKNLKSLREVRVEACEFFAPESLFEIKQLSSLELARDWEDSFQLDSLRQLPKLESVHLDLRRSWDSPLDSLLSIKDLRHLAIIGLLSNYEFLNELNENLESLSLSVSVRSNVTEQLKRFRNLRKLELSGDGVNKIELAEIVKQNPDLTELILAKCLANEELRQAIGALTKLEVLGISTSSEVSTWIDPDTRSVQVGDKSFFHGWGSKPKLKSIELHGGYWIGGDDKAVLQSMESLESVRLHGVRFMPGALDGIQNAKRLKSLKLEYTSEVDLGAMRVLASVEGLAELSIVGFGKRKGKFATGEVSAPSTGILQGIDDLQAWNSIYSLEITNCNRLENSDLEKISRLNSLTRLDLSSNPKIDDLGLASLGNLSTLHVLTMNKFRGDWKGLEAWPNEHPLQYLTADGSSIGQKGIDSLGKLQELEIVSSETRGFGTNRVDILPLGNARKLRLVMLVGKYRTEAESFRKTQAMRPNLPIVIQTE